MKKCQYCGNPRMGGDAPCSCQKKTPPVPNEKLTETERSCMLYLLDAAKVAPNHIQRFVSIVKRQDGSTEFQAMLQTLLESSDIQRTISDMRESLR